MPFEVFPIEEPSTTMEHSTVSRTIEAVALDIHNAYSKVAEFGGRIIADHEVVMPGGGRFHTSDKRWLFLVAEYPEPVREPEPGFSKADFLATGLRRRSGVSGSWYHLVRFVTERAEDEGFPLRLGTPSEEGVITSINGDLDAAIDWVHANSPKTLRKGFFNLMVAVKQSRTEQPS